MRAFEQAVSDLDALWGKGLSARVILGVQVNFCHERVSRVTEFVRKSWTFELSHLSELQEYFAAVRWIGADLDDSFLNRRAASTWQTLIVHGRLRLNHQSPEAAARAINHATVSFAALSAWGCGPTEASALHVSEQVWSTSELKGLLEGVELDRSTPSVPRHHASPRL